jgi:hypothetical protein
MKKFGIFFLLIALAFSACRKDVDVVTTEETPYVPEILKKWEQKIVNVNGSLTGFVANELGEPVAGAAVKLGNLSTTTDDFGHFFFKNVQLNAKGTLVRVEKDGFFPGSRRFLAVEGAENRVKIELMEKLFNQSFQSQDGGIVNLNGGGTITFSPNSIQKEDGTPYNGLVKVAAKWLDPSDIRTLDRMPGSLQGVNLLSEEVVLKTFGMVVAELESEDGQPLNILKGETATIKTPVPASLLAGAPAEIPLWSYNETYGMWAEEGVSKLQNGSYVAEVTHFSYWNHDFKDPLISFTVKLEDENGAPLFNYKVVIRQEGTFLYGHGYTNNLGIVSGLIPANYDLTLEIFNICEEVAYSQPIGPFPNSVDLGTITLQTANMNGITVTGELVDCDGNTVQNGLAIIQFNGQSIYRYINGAPFEVQFLSCGNTSNVTITGYDLDAAVQSDPILLPSSGNLDAGEISVCDVQLQEYLSLTVDGVTQLYVPMQKAFPDTVGTGTTISFYNWSQPSQSFAIDFKGQSTGDYSGAGNIINFFTDNVNNWSFFFGENFQNFTVTEYGNTGEVIKGTFSGPLLNNGVQPPQTVNASGHFSVIKGF